MAMWALTPIRPARRRSSISAGDLITRNSQMRGERSRTSNEGYRSRRIRTNWSSRVKRPSHGLRVTPRWKFENFSVLTSR